MGARGGCAPNPTGSCRFGCELLVVGVVGICPCAVKLGMFGGIREDGGTGGTFVPLLRLPFPPLRPPTEARATGGCGGFCT